MNKFFDNIEFCKKKEQEHQNENNSLSYFCDFLSRLLVENRSEVIDDTCEWLKANAKLYGIDNEHLKSMLDHYKEEMKI